MLPKSVIMGFTEVWKVTFDFKAKVNTYINLAHHRGLSCPILSIILNNTQGINPQIANTQLSHNGYCVPEGFRQCTPGNHQLERRQRLCGQRGIFGSTPAMTQ